MPVRFPLAEGFGIFLGLAAWDLLTDGEAHFLKALLVAVAVAVIWYAARRLYVRFTHTASRKSLSRPSDQSDAEV